MEEEHSRGGICREEATNRCYCCGGCCEACVCTAIKKPGIKPGSSVWRRGWDATRSPLEAAKWLVYLLSGHLWGKIWGKKYPKPLIMTKPDTKYLDQKPSGCWRFKWAVPSDCRAAFDGQTICGTEYKGQKFITKSLGTHSLRDARLVRTQLLAECEYAVREARRQATGDSRELYRAHVRSMEQQVRREPGSLGPLYESMADVEPSTPDQEAFLEALKTVHLGHDSALVKCTLKEALENYQHDREGKVDPKTLSAASRAVTTYLEYVNKLDMPLESISRVDVKGYIRSSEAKGKTISNRLTYLSSIFKAAQDYGKIGEAQRNPFEAHRVERKDS